MKVYVLTWESVNDPSEHGVDGVYDDKEFAESLKEKFNKDRNYTYEVVEKELIQS